ncbi:twin-arginine translocase TatA/TatE family subunit [Nodularia spumigena CS-584]|jgi:sec-independent protein translocase protein TatA|uniref:Sec-independent protein translocase protein TatA n=1 Tax=Nodularia spumigena UHCC 0060 TaxID=3110300 RepID=A0ABU5UP65_NODSP|nr:twin-arginine translocase TatA/TatE family subunit [Nodularia spumigena]AHJ27311.1 Twin-arginine translocation protein TatA [Nodularia spumigena CCY9414]EAW43534.1 Twin-arginine translocation protein TatA/E [Nodularia spumigena CCY9414]MDB9345404.1 twin-arginine translocase TatA/TatE family subunit [Nodularia spumigena CS-588/06]MDB9348806.1 twin-arginine translocase TatA/TatE family subunit [Nodularia spumigena CS-588/01]MDB9350592.1 twin-arginine translocase TatA/TatE family subunit [Nodu
MFGLGLPEVVIIAIVAIVIFGPKKIPELGNALGKTLRGFKEELNSDDDDETTAEQEKQ